MRCSTCKKMMTENRSYDFLNDHAPMIVSSWHCGSCGDIKEEIQIISKDGNTLSRKFRYAVTPI